MKSALLGVLLDDPWRKLASIVLAVLLWEFLDDQVTEHVSVDAAMKAMGPAEDATAVESNTVVLRVDTQSYSVLEIKDARTGEAIHDLSLMLSGAKRLVAAAAQEAVFQVTLEPELRGGRTVAEFDVTDVNAVTARYQGLVQSMNPPKLVVELEQNTTKTINGPGTGSTSSRHRTRPDSCSASSGRTRSSLPGR